MSCYIAIAATFRLDIKWPFVASTILNILVKANCGVCQKN